MENACKVGTRQSATASRKRESQLHDTKWMRGSSSEFVCWEHTLHGSSLATRACLPTCLGTPELNPLSQMTLNCTFVELVARPLYSLVDVLLCIDSATALGGLEGKAFFQLFLGESVWIFFQRGFYFSWLTLHLRLCMGARVSAILPSDDDAGARVPARTLSALRSFFPWA